MGNINGTLLDELDTDLVFEGIDEIAYAAQELDENLSTSIHLNRVKLADTSNEALLAQVPLMADDNDAYEYFKLDVPDVDYIRGQLQVAQEGLLRDIAEGIIPFLGLYLDRTSRLHKLLIKEKPTVSIQLKTISDEKFGKLKVSNLDYKDNFFKQLELAHKILDTMVRSSANIEKFDMQSFEPLLEPLGMKVANDAFKRSSGTLVGVGTAMATAQIGIPHAINKSFYIHHLFQTKINQMTANVIPTAEQAAKLGKAMNTAHAFTQAGFIGFTLFKFASIQALVGGSLSGVISVMTRLLSHNLETKGWTKADLERAYPEVIGLLDNTAPIKQFQSNLHQSYKVAMKEQNGKGSFSLDAITNRAMLEHKYKQILALFRIYSEMVVCMARGLHDASERIS